MAAQLRLLLVEDSEDDALLVRGELERGDFELTMRRVETADSMRAALTEADWDIVIADFNLPTFSATAGLELLSQLSVDIPLIVVSGTIGEMTAVDAMVAGAGGYVMKDNLARLVPAVQRELRAADVRRRQREAESMFQQAQEIAHLGSWEWDIPTNRVSWSDELYRIYGLEPGSVAVDYDGFLERLHPDDRERVAGIVSRAFETAEPFDYYHRVVRPDGSERTLHARGEVLKGPDGQPVKMLGTGLDVTEVKQAEEQFRGLLESAPDAMVIVDEEGLITLINSQTERLFQYTKEELIGESVELLMPERFRDMHPDHRANYFSDPGTRPMGAALDLFGRRKDGSEFPVEISLSPLGTDEGTLVSSAIRDITERKRFETQLHHLADHDALTGLYNRHRFEQELQREVAYSARYGGGGALLMLDLDNFKDVNDTRGHKVGDELIRSVAGLVRERLRTTDVLARLGGDEFAVLLPRVERSEAEGVARDLLEAVRRQALVVGGQRLRLTTSLGLALFDGSDAEGEDLLADADLAMYEAKESGRDRYAVYTRERQAHVQARFTWAERIRRALERDLFVLHAQPILNVAEGRVSQYELLLRMQDGVGGLPRPGAFLPTAERFGLINEIDRWVVKSAIDLIASHRAAGNSLRLEVNISAKSIGDDQLPQLIEHELAATSIDPSSLILEITETAAISNMEEARDFAERLVDLGCRFALDDFGAGFGSFYYLKYLPIDLLKIDGDFIHSLQTSVTDQLVVKAMVGIAHGLGIKTIAEFVGDDDTLDLLRSYGVDYAQGFHVGRPRPLSELLDNSDGELTRWGRHMAAPTQPAP